MRTFYVFLRAVLSVTLLLCVFLVPKNVYADPLDNVSERIGADLRIMRYNGKPFVATDIPTIDFDIPIARQHYVQLEFGWGMQFGITKFYVDQLLDFLPSAGVRVYPFGQYLSVYGKVKWGTYMFNNSTETAELGGDFDFLIGSGRKSDLYLTFGVGYFTRRVIKINQIVNPDKFGQYYIDSKGVVPRFGLIFRFADD